MSEVTVEELITHYKDEADRYLHVPDVLRITQFTIAALERLKAIDGMNGGQYEAALRLAPKPMALRDNTQPYEGNAGLLVMEYGEWYENTVLPLLRRPNPAHGAPRPTNHNPKG